MRLFRSLTCSEFRMIRIPFIQTSCAARAAMRTSRANAGFSQRRACLSSASKLALVVVANGVTMGAVNAQSVCGGSISGATASVNLAGTTCTIPVYPGYTVNVTNNPTTAGTLGTLSLGAASFSTAGGTTATIGGTFVDGTGPSAFTLNAPGYTLVSNVAASYTGPTQILGGTLQAGTSNVFAPNSATTIATGGTLDLGGYSQAINNVQLAGGTIQNGTLSGGVMSSGGTISNTSLGGQLTTTAGTTPSFVDAEQNGGILGGAGTFNGSVTVYSGGIIAPGTNGAPGTLTVNGNVAFTSGSFLQIAATPTQASLLAVNGATTISGGGVVVTAQNATYAPSTAYKILSSTGGVSGTFTGVTANYAYLAPTLSYDANDAYLTLVSNNASIQSVMSSPNTSAVGTAVNSAPNSAIYKAFQTLTPQQAQAAANSISGEGNTQTQTAGTSATRTFTNFISDRATPGGGSTPAAVEVSTPGALPAGVRSYAAMQEFQANTSPIVVDKPQPPTGLRVFATGFGGGSALEGQTSGVAGQKASYYGGLIGVDYRLMPNLLIGAAIGGSNTDFTVAARNTSGSVTGFNGNVFSIASFGAFYAQTLATFSQFSNTTTRNVAGFGAGAAALPSAIEKANYGSFEARGRLEVGRVFNLSETTKINGFKVTPFAAMEIAELTTGGYNEYNPGGGGNVFGLSTSGHTYDDARTFLGARLEASYGLGNGMTLRPIVRLAWVHAFTTAPTEANALQSIPGATFIVAGATVARNAAETKVGAELDIRKNTVVFANFDGEFGNVQQVYGGRAGFRYSF